MPRGAGKDTHRRTLAVMLVALALGALAPVAGADPAPVAAPVTPPAATAPVAPAPADEGRVAGPTVAVAPQTPATATTASARAAVAAVDARPTAHIAAGSAVTIRDFSFGPGAVTIHTGDTVTWTNTGPSPHTATGAGFDTGTLRAGQSASHTFAAAGTFSYHCTIHPFMKGTIRVVAASATAPSATAPPAAGSGAVPPAPAAAPPASSHPTLPHTGLDAPSLAALGALLLVCGAVLRALARPR